jgi:hypothetical protein
MTWVLANGIAPIVVELADICVVLAAEESYSPAVLDNDGGQAVLSHAAHVPGSLEGVTPSAALKWCPLAGRNRSTTLRDGAAALPSCPQKGGYVLLGKRSADRSSLS